MAVVSSTLARTFWPEQRAIGRRLRIAPPAGSNEPAQSVEVVGVAHDVRHAHTDNELADVYLALSQAPTDSAFAYVKTTGPRPGLEREIGTAIASVDRDVPFGMPRMLGEILDAQRAGARFLASLLVVFALFATVLALVGIYGVIAYAVRQREREVAVRMAVGADRPAIVRLFLTQGAAVLGAGLLFGIAGAMALGRVLQAQLFGVHSADPAVLAIATCAFGVCGLLAVSVPAFAAASTDPAAALKE